MGESYLYNSPMSVFDRQRLGAFVRFLWRRFLEDRCLQTAAELAYTSLFALVPLFATLLAILTAFPVYADWRDSLTHFVFRNFVPAAGDVVQDYLTSFAANASKATVIGILVLLFSSIALMLSIEDAFNRIWRVPAGRPALARVLMYWTVLTLGPLLLVAMLALTSYVFALPILDQVEAEYSFKAHVLSMAPFLIQALLLLAAFVLIPHRRVQVRHAILGALLATSLIELAKHAFAAYVVSTASYEQVYGTLAIVPIFILWIYLSWVLVLLGASLTASLAAFEYRPPDAPALARGEEFRGLVRVLALFAAAQRNGSTLHSADLREREPFLTDDLVQRYLGDLDRAGLIQRTERGAWVLSRDLQTLSLYDLYALSGYPLPRGEPLQGGDALADALATRVLADAQTDLRAILGLPLSEIFAAPGVSLASDTETNA
jgi:membrane protein